MVGLAQLLLKSNAGYCLIEDYAACLEQRSEWFQLAENTKDDTGVLIMRVRLFFMAYAYYQYVCCFTWMRLMILF